MQSSASGKRVLIAGIVCVLVGMVVASHSAAAVKCKPVLNPHPNIDGWDLRNIRATGVGCTKAREVARRVYHKEQVGFPSGWAPDDSGLWHLDWNGWAVVIDYPPGPEPSRDTATRRDKRVRWRTYSR